MDATCPECGHGFQVQPPAPPSGFQPSAQVTHGTRSRYRRGCRCDLCREAKRGQAQRHLARLNADPERHARKIARQAKAQAKANAETRPTATRHNYQWTGPELELVARKDLSAKQAALMIGRTAHAVYNMRARLNAEPKIANLAGLPSEP